MKVKLFDVMKRTRIDSRVSGTCLDEDGARLGWLAPSITFGLQP